MMFSNNFWGMNDEGFQVLTAKMTGNKKIFDEIKTFYSSKASLHEEFGRKLMKHAKASHEESSPSVLLTLMRKESEAYAQTHFDLSHQIKDQLEDLDAFVLIQKDQRKLTHTSAEKSHRYKVSSDVYLTKSKKKYQLDCMKLGTLQASQAIGREADKLKQKIKKAQQDIKTSEQEYRIASFKLAEATDQWNENWKSTCDVYQEMEKSRLEYIHQSFSKYIDILSLHFHLNSTSFETFRAALNQYSAESELQDFIEEQGTGCKIPEPERFVDFFATPPVNRKLYTIADAGVKSKEEKPNVKDLSKSNFSMRTIPKTPQRHFPKRSFSLTEKQQPKNILSRSFSLTERHQPKDISVLSLPSIELQRPKNIPSRSFSLIERHPAKKAPSRSFSLKETKLNEFTYTASNGSEWVAYYPKNTIRRSCSDITKQKNSIDIFNQETQVSFPQTNHAQHLLFPHQMPRKEAMNRKRKESIQKQLYCPPLNFSNKRPVLFWAIAITDWLSCLPGELQYTKGSRIAIVDDGQHWYFGIKWDQCANAFTNESGFVAPHCIRLFFTS
ncbi:hypothetical protein BY458DRAFT_505041 [Sporodiniella umbellata]|nr:hypothetical protein BY458DRAFT_505041 [Sporodiniella umbellata]